MGYIKNISCFLKGEHGLCKEYIMFLSKIMFYLLQDDCSLKIPLEACCACSSPFCLSSVNIRRCSWHGQYRHKAPSSSLKLILRLSEAGFQIGHKPLHANPSMTRCSKNLQSDVFALPSSPKKAGNRLGAAFGKWVVYGKMVTNMG